VERYFILRRRLRNGSTSADSRAVGFLKEALAKMEGLEWIRRVRANSEFCAEELLQYLQEVKMGYIVVARLTPCLKRESAQVTEWRAMDAICAEDEFELNLLGRASWNSNSTRQDKTRHSIRLQEVKKRGSTCEFEYNKQGKGSFLRT